MQGTIGAGKPSVKARMPRRQRQPGEGQGQAVGAAPRRRPARVTSQGSAPREHGDALIPAKRAGHLAQHLTDEKRAKCGRQRNQEGRSQGKVVARQGFRVSFWSRTGSLRRRTGRDAARIRTAPRVIAVSATLNVGQCQSRQ